MNKQKLKLENIMNMHLMVNENGGEKIVFG